MTQCLDPAGVDESTLTADVDLPLGPEAAALARRTVRDLLRGWRIGDEEFLHDAVLVTSELVGNAIRHDGRRVALRLVLDGPRLTLAVSDGSSVLPSQRSDEDEESGRGLTIISAIADEWGVSDRPDGKTVWVELSASDAQRRHSRVIDGDADQRPVSA